MTTSTPTTSTTRPVYQPYWVVEFTLKNDPTPRPVAWFICLVDAQQFCDKANEDVASVAQITEQTYTVRSLVD